MSTLSNRTWNTNPAGGNTTRTPTSATSSNNTYLLPTSPMKGNRSPRDQNYKPTILHTVGQRPACLVNASVTYCCNNQIYAFGGFDQYTDEGKPLIGQKSISRHRANFDLSLQSRVEARSQQSTVVLGRQLRRYSGRSHGCVLPENRCHGHTNGAQATQPAYGRATSYSSTEVKMNTETTCPTLSSSI